MPRLVGNGFIFQAVSALPTASAALTNAVHAYAGSLWFCNGVAWVWLAALAPPSTLINTLSAVNTTETYINTTVPYKVAANQLQVGAAFRITVYGFCTSTNPDLVTWTLRLGTAGTTADTSVLVSTSTAASGSSISFKMEWILKIKTTGSAGGMSGVSSLINQGVTGISNAANVVNAVGVTATVNTTVANFLGVSLKTAATTTSVTIVTINIEKIG